MCDSCRQASMPYPITEDSRDDKLQGDIFQKSALSPSKSKWISIEPGAESGSTTSGPEHGYFYPHHQTQELEPFGLVVSPTPQLLSLPSSLASDPRPATLSLPNVPANDKGHPQYLQPDQSNPAFDNHLQKSNLRQSLKELTDYGVVDVSYKNQVKPGPIRYFVDPPAATIHLFCFYRYPDTNTIWTLLWCLCTIKADLIKNTIVNTWTRFLQHGNGLALAALLFTTINERRLGINVCYSSEWVLRNPSSPCYRRTLPSSLFMHD